METGAAAVANGAGTPQVLTTRQLLVEVTQREILERGYHGASLRSIARRADVDPSLVRHYFGLKRNLLMQAVQTGLDPQELAAGVLRGAPDSVGPRIVNLMMDLWDTPATSAMALVRLAASLTNAEVAELAKETFMEPFFGAIAKAVSPDRPELRASLAASQLTALAISRNLIADPQLSLLDRQELVPVIGRTVQRYLTGPLPVDATGSSAHAGRTGPAAARQLSA